MTELRLEPLARHHLPAVAEPIADPQVLRFTRIPEPPAADFPERWPAIYERGRQRVDAELWSRLPSDGYIGAPCAPD